MRRAIFALFIVVLTLQPLALYAASPWTEEVGYWDWFRGKLTFGIANFWGGWLALIHEPVTAVQDKKNVFVGIGKGLAYSVIFTAGGLAHMLTSPITSLDIPLPDNGVDVTNQ